MSTFMKAAGSPSTWRLLVGYLLLFVACTSMAVAETFTVTKTEDDDGPCTLDDCALREAVIAANATPGADRVVLSSGVYTLTINGTGDEYGSMTGDLDIVNDDLEVVGDPSGTTVIEGQVDDRVIEIGFSVVTFSNIEITGGHRTGVGTSTFGGCVRMTASDVTFLDSSITGCYCQYEGGGIAAQGAKATFINSTLTGNESETLGGAIYHVGGLDPDESLTLINTTVSGNRADIAGGGIYRSNEGRALISHSTIAYNEAPSGEALYLDFPIRRTWIENSLIEGKCRGLLPSLRGVNATGPHLDDHCFKGSLDGNLLVEDLGLGPLAANNGRTLSHNLLPGSPAIDTGDPAYCEATDQRGIPRPQDAGCDIGAVEAVSTAPTDIPALGPWGLAGLILLLGSVGLGVLRRR